MTPFTYTKVIMFFWHAQVGLRTPRFDSLAVNSYKSGEGICPHVDLLRYEDGIAIVSLLSAVNMDFSLVSTRSCPSAGINPQPPSQDRDKQQEERSVSDQLDWNLDRHLGPGGAHFAAGDTNTSNSLDIGTHTDSLVSLSAGSTVSDGAELPVKGFDSCPDQLVRLEPGDVLTLHGDARYMWTHGIKAVPADMWQGRTVDRRRRISLTFRTLSHARDL